MPRELGQPQLSDPRIRTAQPKALLVRRVARRRRRRTRARDFLLGQVRTNMTRGKTVQPTARVLVFTVILILAVALVIPILFGRSPSIAEMAGIIVIIVGGLVVGAGLIVRSIRRR